MAVVRLASLIVAIAVISLPSSSALRSSSPPSFSAFYGVWTGSPDYSPVGPMLSSQSFNFAIRPLSQGGFLMSDAFLSTAITNSTQAFYSNGTALVYCGLLWNFFGSSSLPPAPIQVMFDLQATSNATQMTWCDVIAGCEFAQWDLWIRSDKKLEMIVKLAAPVVHTHVIFTRAASLPALPSVPLHWSMQNFSCNFTIPPPRCPFSRRNPTPVAIPTHSASPSYCYQLNDALQYRVRWSVDLKSQDMAVSVSVNAGQNDWIGFGFEPQFPGMVGADIVLGYVTASGTPCVRSMYADYYVGPPQDNTTMVISQTSIAFSSNRLTMNFTRAFNTGANPIPLQEPPFPQARPLTIMWATGLGPLQSCADVPQYHASQRGVMSMNWITPSYIFNDYQQC